VNDIATGAAFDILATNAAPIVCVLRMELDLLPGMGRMTGRLLLTYMINYHDQLVT
jgi:hypothetical protein